MTNPVEEEDPVGNGKLLQVTAIGKVRMEVATSVGHETMELSNVYVVPEMKCRLLSSNWAWQHDNGAHTSTMIGSCACPAVRVCSRRTRVMATTESMRRTRQ